MKHTVLFMLGLFIVAGCTSNTATPAEIPTASHVEESQILLSVFHEGWKDTRKQGCGRLPAPLFSGFSWLFRDLQNIGVSLRVHLRLRAVQVFVNIRGWRPTFLNTAQRLANFCRRTLRWNSLRWFLLFHEAGVLLMPVEVPAKVRELRNDLVKFQDTVLVGIPTLPCDL